MRYVYAILLLLVTNATTSIALSNEGHRHGKMDSHAKPGAGGALGGPVKNGKISRTIKISMNDQLRFDPDKITVKSGETVKFLVTNIGQVRHEIVIGSPEELKEHAEMMKQMPDMKHTDDNQLVLEPKKTGELIWKFNKAGELQYGCFEPGHIEAGMQGEITVN